VNIEKACTTIHELSGFTAQQSHAGIRTGRWLKPRTNEDRTRVGSPTTSIASKRRRSSSHRIFNCNSARRLPTQRWMPKPKDRCCRGRSRSMMKWFGAGFPRNGTTLGMGPPDFLGMDPPNFLGMGPPAGAAFRARRRTLLRAAAASGAERRCQEAMHLRG
jgi:hypothetical protein